MKLYLFAGTMHWMGLGKMTFPKEVKPANQFNAVGNDNLVHPLNGFENIFNQQLTANLQQVAFRSRIDKG